MPLLVGYLGCGDIAQGGVRVSLGVCVIRPPSGCQQERGAAGRTSVRGCLPRETWVGAYTSPTLTLLQVMVHGKRRRAGLGRSSGGVNEARRSLGRGRRWPIQSPPAPTGDGWEPSPAGASPGESSGRCVGGVEVGWLARSRALVADAALSRGPPVGDPTTVRSPASTQSPTGAVRPHSGSHAAAWLRPTRLARDVRSVGLHGRPLCRLSRRASGRAAPRWPGWVRATRGVWLASSSEPSAPASPAEGRG